MRSIFMSYNIFIVVNTNTASIDEVDKIHKNKQNTNE